MLGVILDHKLVFERLHPYFLDLSDCLKQSNVMKEEPYRPHHKSKSFGSELPFNTSCFEFEC